MILTTIDVSSLSRSLTRWEWTEYISEGLVVLACLGELVSDVGQKWLGEHHKTHLERWSTVVLIVALAVSLTALVRTNELSGFVIGSLGDRAEEADRKAKTAIDDARQAQTLAQYASDTAGPAKTSADAAALKVAAVSNRADQIDAQLGETQWAFSARDLLDRDAVIEQLKQFRGKTVSVRSYVATGDVDGYRVCQMVLDLARKAGMTPIDECAKLSPSIPPATGIQVCGPDDNEMLSLSKALSRIDIGGTCPFGPVPHSPNLTVSVGAKALMAVGRTSQTIDAAKRAGAAKNHKASKPSTKP